MSDGLSWGSVHRCNLAPQDCTLRALAISARTPVLGRGPLETPEIAGAEIVAVAAMERRIRPILDAGDEAVLDGVEPAVVDVMGMIVLVADQMLPVAPLPDTALAARPPRLRAPFTVGNGFREADLDKPPAQWKIAVAVRQGPDACR